jgi:ecotin
MFTLARITLLITVVSLLTYSVAADEPDLKPFDDAGENEDRFVISLPHKERGEEDLFKVELVCGRTMMTDGVNQYRMGNRFEDKTVEGWGYPYYNVTGNSEIAGTLMAAPPGQPQVEKFVTGQSHLIRYNSRIPIVVYVPEGLEIRYRIWSTSELMEKAEAK